MFGNRSNSSQMFQCGLFAPLIKHPAVWVIVAEMSFSTCLPLLPRSQKAPRWGNSILWSMSSFCREYKASWKEVLLSARPNGFDNDKLCWDIVAPVIGAVNTKGEMWVLGQDNASSECRNELPEEVKPEKKRKKTLSSQSGEVSICIQGVLGVGGEVRKVRHWHRAYAHKRTLPAKAKSEPPMLVTQFGFGSMETQHIIGIHCKTLPRTFSGLALLPDFSKRPLSSLQPKRMCALLSCPGMQVWHVYHNMKSIFQPNSCHLQV